MLYIPKQNDVLHRKAYDVKNTKKVVVHINRHTQAKNNKTANNSFEPSIIIKRSGEKNIYAHGFMTECHMEMHQSPKPQNCSAKIALYFKGDFTYWIFDKEQGQ